MTDKLSTQPIHGETKGITMSKEIVEKNVAELAETQEIIVPDASFDDLASYAASGEAVLDYREIIDQATIVGMPFIIFGIEVHASDRYKDQTDFVTMHIKTKDERVGVVNSGGDYTWAGSVRRAAERGVLNFPILIKNGLKMDEYDNSTGEKVKSYRFA